MTLKREYLEYLGIDDKIKEAYEKVFHSEEGILVLGDLKHKFSFYEDSGTVDPNQSLREAGERGVLCYLMKMSRQFSDSDIDAINRLFMDKE